MSHYDGIRNRIERQMVPLPILFREDHSIDHAGMAAFVEWQMENETRNFCLTFTYSQLDFITREEIVDVTRNIVSVVRDDAVFISCTGGGPLHECIETVQQIEAAGCHAAFIHLPEHCLQNSFRTGEIYVKYIRDVAKESRIPLLAVALGVPWVAPIETMLPLPRLEELCEEEQFIGIKDDIYVLDNRREISYALQGRMGVTGGGMFTHYIFFHHLPNQGEFSGIYDPRRGHRMYQLLDEGNYQEVIRMMHEQTASDGEMEDPPHWMARNQVVFYGMGFAETYLMRSPLQTATREQAEQILQHMRANPLHFERIDPERRP